MRKHDRRHADEDDRQRQQVGDGHDRAAGVEHALEDRQLAEERPEGRRAGDGQEAGQPEHAGDRQRPQHAADAGGRLGAVEGQDVAGRQEQHRLGQRVIDGVQHRAEGGHAADADAEREDAHVLDAGIGQHPLEVGLAEDEHGGHGHRDQAEEHQQIGS